MDPELKALLEKAQAAIGDTKSLKDAVANIEAWGAAEGGEKARLTEAEKAIKQVNDQVKAMEADLMKKLQAAQQRSFDMNGKYRGAFGSAAQAACLALAILSTTSAHATRATEILESDHKDFLEQRAAQFERAGVPHDGETGFATHEHSSAILRLVEDYGHARRLARVLPVSAPTGTWHKNKAGLRAHKTKVRAAVQEQSGGWGIKNWSVDDYDILTSYPISLSEDMLVAFAELLAVEIAQGFSRAEDENLFIGDGTDAYDNVMGIVPRLININGVNDGGGLVLADGNLWSEITEANVDKALGQARYVRPGMGKIVCSNEFFWQVLQKFTTGKGGVTLGDAERGPRYVYKGVPVEIVPVMARAQGNSQIPMLYGDFDLAATIYDRKQLQIRESREARFESKEVVMLATERIDIQADELGDVDTAGPVVGVITAAA